MKQLLAVATILLLSALPLSAQTAAPKEPAIVLPPVLMKVEDVTQANIDTPLPPEKAPALPDISVALPQAQNIKLGTSALDVPPPSEGPAGEALTLGGTKAQTFFTDGMIGAGSMNQVLGDITLYKLGADPRFSIEFSHERLDGYLGSTSLYPYYPAGKGYFNQTDALVGSLTYQPAGPFSLSSNDFYRETEDGLQQLGSGSYSSVLHRYLSGHLTGSYAISTPFSIGSSLDATYTDMTLSGALPETSSEVFARPAVNLALTLQTVKLGLEGYYGLEQTNGQTASTLQNAGSTLTLTAKLPLSLSFDGSVGFAWDDAVGMHVPFSLELDGAYRDLLTYKLYGGYRIERPSYFDIWSSYHFLDQGAALMPSLNWYGGVSSQMRLGPTFALDAGVGYTQASATVIPSSFVQSEQLFSFLQLPTETLGPSVSLSWNPPGPFSLNLGWKGAFINPGAFAPVSTFTLDAELNAPSGKFGGSLSGSSNIYSDPSLLSEELPNLTLSGFFRVSDGVLFRLDVNDILSPLLPGGRKLWDTYTQPGFHIVLRTQISL